MKTAKAGVYILAILMGCSTAHAQTQAQAGEDTITDIVVTAQRRIEVLSEVPLSISAITGEELTRKRIRDTSDLVSLAPGLTGKAQGIATPVFAIRGISTNSIGIGGESSIGVFWDEGYLGRLESANLPFYDLERVEVLKGPQSTLFGRNASAGAISVRSRRPRDHIGADASLSYGSFNEVQATVGVDVPVVSDKLLLRTSGYYHRSDGTEQNILLNRSFGGGETISARAVLTAKPSDKVDLTAIAYFVKDNGGGFPSKTIDPTLSAAGRLTVNPFDGRQAQNIGTFENRQIFAGNFEANIELGSGLSLKSITTALRTNLDRQFDGDGSALPLLSANFRDYRDETFGQEIRLIGDSDHINWFIGGSFFSERIRQNADLGFSENALVGGTPIPDNTLFPGQPAFQVCAEPLTTVIFGGPCNDNAVERISGRGRYQSYAGFGDLTYKITDALKITVGARVSYDRKNFTYSVAADTGIAAQLRGGNIFSSATAGDRQFQRDFSSLQPRLVLNYKLRDEAIIFGSISKGFKAGGFDPAATIDRVPFNPETVWAYEIGTRLSTPDHKARIAASVYFQDYNGYQIQVLRNGTTSTINAPKVRSYGAEVEATWKPVRWFTFEVNAALNSATFRRLSGDTGNLAGNRLLYAPEFTGFAAIEIEAVRRNNWSLFTRGSLRHESSQFFTRENRPTESASGFSVVDASVTLALNNPVIKIRAFARNLLAEKYLIYAVDQGFGVVVNRGEPRLFGIEVSGAF
jgi:iron complex outermembrane recepter protein